MNGRRWPGLVTLQGLSFPKSEEGGSDSLPAPTAHEIEKLSLAMHPALKKEKQTGDTTLHAFSSDVSFAYFIMTRRKRSERRAGLQK